MTFHKFLKIKPLDGYLIVDFAKWTANLRFVGHYYKFRAQKIKRGAFWAPLSHFLKRIILLLLLLLLPRVSS